jgi:hypothetical protein
VHWVLKTGPTTLLLGIGAGAYAAGTYESLIVCLALVLPFAILVEPTRRVYIRSIALVMGSLAVSLVIRSIARWVLGVPDSHYVDKFFDVDGLLHHGPSKVFKAVVDTAGVFGLPREVYGRSSPWLALTLVVLIAGAVWQCARRPRDTSSAVAVAMFLLAPVAAAALVVHVPIASLLYLPLCVLGLGAVAAKGATQLRGRLRRPVLVLSAALAALTIVSNAILSNNVLAETHVSLLRDQRIAFDVEGVLRTAVPDASFDKPVTVVVSAPKTWPSSPFGESPETMYTGARWAGPKFLNTMGIPAAAPTRDAWIAGLAAMRTIPQYPAPGYATMRDGVLLVNLGAPPAIYAP